MTEIPIIIAGIDQLIRDAKKSKIISKEGGDFREFAAWNAWFV